MVPAEVPCDPEPYVPAGIGSEEIDLVANVDEAVGIKPFVKAPETNNSVVHANVPSITQRLSPTSDTARISVVKGPFRAKGL
jgi:hypothetical protein